MRRLIAYGSPSGLQLVVEITGFTVFLFLMDRLGKLEAAANSLAFSVNMLAFMPVYGASTAAATLVGQRLGENRAALAARAAWTAFALALAYMLLFSAIYVLVPDAILWIHSTQVKPEEFGALRDMTVVLLRFIAAYCLFDAMYAVFGGAIRGAGDTRFVLYSASIITSLAVTVTVLGLQLWGFGMIACWATFTAWVWTLGVTYMVRFIGGKWRNMRVIEPHVDVHALASRSLQPNETYVAAPQ
jgi:MATE family multidrug resistance protein